MSRFARTRFVLLGVLLVLGLLRLADRIQAQQSPPHADMQQAYYGCLERATRMQADASQQAQEHVAALALQVQLLRAQLAKVSAPPEEKKDATGPQPDVPPPQTTTGPPLSTTRTDKD